MDMHSREQYLETLREEYRRASKQEKSRLLNEAGRPTRLNRKVLIRKLAHPRPVGERRRARRKASYGSEVVSALVVVWARLHFRSLLNRGCASTDVIGCHRCQG